MTKLNNRQIYIEHIPAQHIAQAYETAGRIAMKSFMKQAHIDQL